MTDDIEPLAAPLWFERIEMIARGELGTVENSLRHAAHLLQLAPRPLRHVVRLALEESAFEALLDAGELDRAAHHLIAQPTALSVSHEPNEPARATLSCAILQRAVHGTGETAAAAILNAWTGCLLALKTQFGPELLNFSDQLPRTAPHEPDRRSS